MKARRPVAVVVDTSIASACGKEGTTHPQGLACLDTLKVIREGDLALTMSAPIFEEWQRHAGSFARKWLSKMRSSRRVKDVSPRPHNATRRAAKALPDEGIRRAIEKDMILVEAALATDHRVLSLDEKIRGYLCDLTRDVADLRKIHWANPMTPACIPWVREGAPDDARWLLREVP
jgi:hypothetical protein